MLSDTDSSDSDSGIRFKTASTRDKFDTARPTRLSDNNNASATRGSNDDRFNGNRSLDNNDRDRRDRGERDRRDHREQQPRRDVYAPSSYRREKRSQSRDRDRRQQPRSNSRDRSGRSSNQRGSSAERRRERSARDTERKTSKDNTGRTERKSDPPIEKRPTTSKNSSAEKERPKAVKTPAMTVQVSKPSKDHQKSASIENAATLKPLMSIEPILDDAESNIKPKHHHKKHKSTRSKERISLHDNTDAKTLTNQSVAKAMPERESSKSVQRDARKSVSPKLDDVSLDTDDLSQDEVSVCGPQLPPHLIKPTHDRKEPSPKQRVSPDRILGPALPPSIQKPSSSHSTETARVDRPGPSTHQTTRRIQGPVAPSPQFLLDHHQNMSDISDDDDCLIGPVPDGSASKSEAHLELEKRALKLKLAKFTEMDAHDDLVVRDEWMLELPEVKGVTDMGLTARQFRTKERPDFGDRSSWTDTPQDREHKTHHKKGPSEEELRKEKQREAKALFNANRDNEQEEAARKHKKKHRRDESLMDIHQKKLKKEKSVGFNLEYIFDNFC